MDFRFTAHDPQSGDFLHRLPRPEKVQIGDTFGTRGTLELTYSAKALNAKPMPSIRRDPAAGNIRQRRELVRHRTQLSAPVRIP